MDDSQLIIARVTEAAQRQLGSRQYLPWNVALAADALGNVALAIDEEFQARMDSRATGGREHWRRSS